MILEIGTKSGIIAFRVFQDTFSGTRRSKGMRGACQYILVEKDQNWWSLESDFNDLVLSATQPTNSG